MPQRTHIEEIEEQAALFALGALEPEQAKRFSQRLNAGCPLCRAEVEDCEAALALMAAGAPEATPPERLRDRLLERIGVTEKPAPMSAAGVVIRANEVPWKPGPFPGVDFRFLHERKTMLVRMAPKARIPAHPHAAAEQCLVLEGSVTTDGLTAYAGDYTYMPAGSTHDDLYSENGALFLIAYS
jgi:anti-sigma factor ChrR (cupin superfamily)